MAISRIRRSRADLYQNFIVRRPGLFNFSKLSAWEEPRSRHQQTKREKPQTPEDIVDCDSLAMQAKEKHRQCVPLRFVEYRKEIGAAQESQGSDVIQRIHKHDRDRH